MSTLIKCVIPQGGTAAREQQQQSQGFSLWDPTWLLECKLQNQIRKSAAATQDFAFDC